MDCARERNMARDRVHVRNELYVLVLLFNGLKCGYWTLCLGAVAYL